MAQEIYSKTIGQLIQHDQFDDWWESGEIEIPFFDHKGFTVIFMDYEPGKDSAFMDEADQALTDFLKLNSEDRIAISGLAYKNCTDFLDIVEPDEADEPLRQIEDINDIWDFIYPTGIYVARRHHRDKDIYITIACNCEWEREHGFQLVFRQGKKLTRVSDEDGHLTKSDAFGITDEEDELLSQF